MIKPIQQQKVHSYINNRPPLITSLFISNFHTKKQFQPYQLILHQNFIILKKSIKTQHQSTLNSFYLIQLNFDLKYQIIHKDFNSVINPIQPNQNILQGLKFIKIQHQQLQFYNQNDQIIAEWKKKLLKKINRYDYTKIFKSNMKIGRGSFASVFLATNLQQKKRVAVKCYSKKDIQSDYSKKLSLINEISILRKLNHKNLNQFYGIYQSSENIYVILELIDGGQLAYKFQSKYKFSSTQIKSILKNILSALKHLHDNNIMHRDIKPENILFRSKSQQIQAVIVDFGLASFVNAKNYLFYKCGTPGYIAPEILKQTKKKKIDPVCDIFSAGVIFHQLLTGKSIFANKGCDDLLQQNIKCQFDLNIPLYAKFTLATVDLLKKMLDTNPFTRISAQQALQHPFFREPEIKRSKYKITNSYKQMVYNSSEYVDSSQQQEQRRREQRKSSIMLRKSNSKYQKYQSSEKRLINSRPKIK